MKEFFRNDSGILYQGKDLELLESLETNSVDLVFTSPPYNKGWYGKFEIGPRSTWNKANINYEGFSDAIPPDEYEKWQVKLIEEIIRVLKPSGSLFYNHKEFTYGGGKMFFPKYVFKFNVRETIIWDRRGSIKLGVDYFIPVTEYIFWIVKERPKFKRNYAIFKNNIWSIMPDTNNEHPAPFPIELPENAVLTTTDPGDLVLDPYMGSGTTALAAQKHGRKWIGVEMSEEYCKLIQKNLSQKAGGLW